MIPRYSRPEMADIWSDNARYGIWLEVELLAFKKMTEAGLAPKEAYDEAKAKARFTPERIAELEAELKHDVIAFLTCVAEHVGPTSRFIHRGMTSSDLIDTGLAVQLNRAGKMILAGIDRASEAVKKRALEHKHTPCIGRSHGIHAEPTTFGLKLLSWFTELQRNRIRLEAAVKDVSVGKISGAVGTYSSLPPVIEEGVLRELGLRPEPVSSQIIPRDRHAAFFEALALLASSLERFCVEIRHLQRTEVREVEEKFTKGQKGSSAMPHKRNPILSENLSGLARLVRSYSLAALENVPLWHERDISHSSVERVIAPDACIAIDFMLERFRGIVEGVVVYPEQMRRNLDLTGGLISSGALLVALVDRGMIREKAYAIVQQHALAAWDSGAHFRERVSKDSEITSRIPPEELAAVFEIGNQLKQVDFIFERALRSEHPMPRAEGR